METSAKLLFALSLFGVAQALLLTAVLLTVNRGNRMANRFLAGFVAVLAIGVGGSMMASEPLIFLFPHLLKIQDSMQFLAAPLLFLYIRTLLKGSPPGKKDLLHFIPFFLALIFLVPFYFQSGDAKFVSISSYSDFWRRWTYIRSTTLLIQVITYLALIAVMLAAYSRRLKQQPSPADKSVRFQVRFMLAALSAIWILGALKYAITTAYPVYDTQTADLLVPASLSLFVYAMAYIGLRRPEALTGAEDPPPPSPPSRRYEKSTLTVERSETYLQKLLDVMANDKPYLNGELNLQKLAKSLAISPHHLSQMINEQLSQNFFDFINHYRIEEAKRMLADPARKHYSILAVSEEVGFNSKSAFNTAFKKHANMTPSEFRKSIAANGTVR